MCPRVAEKNEARSRRRGLNVKPRWLNGNIDTLVDGYINIVNCNWCNPIDRTSVRGFVAVILSVSKVWIMMCDGQCREEAQTATAGKQKPSGSFQSTPGDCEQNERLFHYTFLISAPGTSCFFWLLWHRSMQDFFSFNCGAQKQRKWNETLHTNLAKKTPCFEACLIPCVIRACIT